MTVTWLMVRSGHGIGTAGRLVGLCAADGGVVPGAVGVADEIDLRLVDGEAGDVDLAAEDEGDHLDVDFDLGGLKEGLVAEGRVVGEGGVLRRGCRRGRRGRACRG